MSAFKVRRITDLIRGRTLEEALFILIFLPYKASYPILKVLKSASKNAQHNLGLSKTSLFVSRIWVQEGPTLKRFQPRAQGRGFPIRKPLSHIVVVLTQKVFGNLLLVSLFYLLLFYGTKN